MVVRPCTEHSVQANEKQAAEKEKSTEQKVQEQQSKESDKVSTQTDRQIDR